MFRLARVTRSRTRQPGAYRNLSAVLREDATHHAPLRWKNRRGRLAVAGVLRECAARDEPASRRRHAEIRGWARNGLKLLEIGRARGMERVWMEVEVLVVAR